MESPIARDFLPSFLFYNYTQMKKLFNFRPIVILAIAMIVAISFAIYVFESANSKIIMFAIFLIAFFIVTILASIFKKKFLAMISAILLFVALPFISVYFRNNNLKDNAKFENVNVLLSAKISGNFKYTTSGNLEILLDDVTLVSGNEISNIDGKVAIYTVPSKIDLTKIESGRLVEIKTNLSFYTLDSEDISKSMSYLTRNIVASGFAMFYNINFLDNFNETLRDKVCNGVFDLLSSQNVEYAEIGYAMMFGDSNVLDSDIKNEFRSTGIAHLLAVSGLHVSIIVMIFWFILRKLKVNYKINLALSIIFLSIYCYLCNFSVSVIRASLMAVFALYAQVRGKAYDNLSILALVAMIVLLIDPIEMFNISFVLSFSAVLSIILLSKPLSRLFDKVFYSKVSNTLALSLSVQIGLFATNLFYFGRYPVLGIFANIVAIPIATLSFIVLIVGVCVSAIFPFMAFINQAFSVLMGVVVRFNNWISSIGVYLRLGSIPLITILLTFAFMVFVSDYIFIKPKHKAFIGGGLAICLVLAMLI